MMKLPMDVPLRETIAAAALCTTLAAAAGAQQHPAIERCMQTDSDKDRIACLEATILAISEGREPPVIEAAAVAEPASAPVAEAAPEVVVEAAPEPVDGAAPEPVAEQPAEPMPALPEVTEENVLDIAAAEAAALDIDDQANIGQEQVDARTETRDERLARLSEVRGLKVSEFEYVGYRKLQVRLENGQIWRQIKGDVQDIRVSVGRNPTVDISESSIGGYKLRLNEIKRTIRVQRIR